jgi:hypothetical protein
MLAVKRRDRSETLEGSSPYVVGNLAVFETNPLSPNTGDGGMPGERTGEPDGVNRPLMTTGEDDFSPIVSARASDRVARSESWNTGDSTTKAVAPMPDVTAGGGDRAIGTVSAIAEEPGTRELQARKADPGNRSVETQDRDVLKSTVAWHCNEGAKSDEGLREGVISNSAMDLSVSVPFNALDCVNKGLVEKTEENAKGLAVTKDPLTGNGSLSTYGAVR